MRDPAKRNLIELDTALQVPAGITEEGVRELIRHECQKMGSQAAWCRENLVNPEVLSMVLNGHRAPTKSILGPLRLEEKIIYVKRPK